MSLVQILSLLYAVTGVGVLAAYVPQVLAAARSRNGARDVSLLTWSAWAVAAGVSSAYAGVVVRDPGFLLIGIGNTIGCCAVVTVTLWRRRGPAWLLPGAGQRAL